MWGRHGSCGSVDHTPSHPPLDQPSRQLVSADMRVSVADHAEAGNEALAEADIAAAEEVIGEAFGDIWELNLVDVVCQMMRTLKTMLLVAIAPA